MLKTSGFALGFQHFPRDLANVNEWKIMFDPSIVVNFEKKTAPASRTEVMLNKNEVMLNDSVS